MEWGAAPRITVGLPVHDGEGYLDQALASLLAQEGVDLEVVVVDNGSTDGTSAICLAWAARDPRVRCYRNGKDRGAASSFNRCLQLARGTYFKWAAHDDLCAPAFLVRCAWALDADPSAVLAYTQVRVIDASGRTLEDYDVRLATDADAPPQRFADVVLSWHRCYEVFGLVRRRALTAVAPLGGYAGADRVLLAELALRGRFVEVPERLFLARRHAGQSVRALASNRERTGWFDTAAVGRIALPEWRQALGFARAAARGPLSPRHRARCAAVVARWCARHGGGLARDVAAALRQRRVPGSVPA